MSLAQDLHFGVRILARQPGLSAVAVLVLALGIGLPTTMFSIVHGTLMRGLPFPDSDRIVAIARTHPAEGRGDLDVPAQDYLDWRARQRSCDDLGAFILDSMVASTSDGAPERYQGAYVTPSTFAVLGVRPLLGQTFAEAGAGATEPAVVIGFRMWRDRFAARPDVLGETLRVNTEAMTVVGVMPAGFAFPLHEDLWLPLRVDPVKLQRGEGPPLTVFGRLKEGVSLRQAGAEFAALASQLELSDPETHRGFGAAVAPYTRMLLGSALARLLYSMLGAVLGILLVACANVANLLLAWAAIRGREVAVRSALGATRGQVVRQLLVETLVLAGAGGILGLLLAQVGIGLFNRAIVDTNPPFWVDVHIDPTVALFVAGLVLATALISGLAPAWRASRVNITETLKDESRGAPGLRVGRVSRTLVVAQVALSCSLLFCAGLMIKSIVKLSRTHPGYATENVLTARLDLPALRYATAEQRRQFYERLTARLSGLPGVEAVALTSVLPGTGVTQPISIEGGPEVSGRPGPRARQAAVSSAYFDAFSVDVVEGRAFAPEDRGDRADVAIVNISFARLFFPGQRVLGRRFSWMPAAGSARELTIVGVVPDMFLGGPDQRNPEGFYVPLSQQAVPSVSLVVRTPESPLTLTPAIRNQVNTLDPDLPVSNVNSMRELLRAGTWGHRVFGSLFTSFGTVALLLASMGLFALVSFSVNRRRQEIGVRRVLGAGPADVAGLVFRQGLGQLVVGLTIGLGLAMWLSRLLVMLLYEVTPTDPGVLVAIVLVLILAAALACLVPTLRALRVDPMDVLKHE